MTDSTVVPTPPQSLVLTPEVRETARILRERFGDGVKLYVGDDLERIPYSLARPLRAQS